MGSAGDIASSVGLFRPAANGSRQLIHEAGPEGLAFRWADGGGIRTLANREPTSGAREGCRNKGRLAVQAGVSSGAAIVSSGPYLFVLGSPLFWCVGE